MTRPSTIVPPATPDTYADKVTTLRVYRMRPHDSSDADYAEPGILFDQDGYVQTPWQLDGYNENTCEVTEALDNFVSHADAIAAIPRFIQSYGIEFEAYIPQEVSA